MHLNSAPANPKTCRGWILDLYPSAYGEMTVWIIAESGERIKFTDRFRPKIYVSGKEDLGKLASRFLNSRIIASWNFVYKYANATDLEKSKVLEVELKDCTHTSFFTNEVLEIGRYLTYQVYNCDLHGDQAYLYDHDLFPLAFVEIEAKDHDLNYTLLDFVESTDYQIPPLRIMKLKVDIAKKRKIADFNDPINKIIVTEGEKQTCIDSSDEREQLLRLVKIVKDNDPDFILTRGGDSYLFPYLARRAAVNNVLTSFILSRDEVPLIAKQKRGRTFFSYGRTFYRAPMRRLYGRIHLDEKQHLHPR